MAVYVDRMKAPLGRMLMSHLVADTPGELRQMAAQLGLERYIQYPGTPKEHLDVSQSKRAEALRLGAVEIDGRRLVEIIRAKRQAQEERKCT